MRSVLEQGHLQPHCSKARSPSRQLCNGLLPIKIKVSFRNSVLAFGVELLLSESLRMIVSAIWFTPPRPRGKELETVFSLWKCSKWFPSTLYSENFKNYQICWGVNYSISWSNVVDAFITLNRCQTNIKDDFQTVLRSLSTLLFINNTTAHVMECESVSLFITNHIPYLWLFSTNGVHTCSQRTLESLAGFSSPHTINPPVELTVCG